MTETNMSLEDWLDDLCVRFIINLPEEDLSSVERIVFQVEEAHWFYEDFVRPLDPTLPQMPLRQFCFRIFKHCPLLTALSDDFHRAFDTFMEYKTRIPVRGAILLNEAMDSALLVKGWKKSASWSFPRGKINKDEDSLECAIREVYEETGFDIKAAGLVPRPGEAKYIEVTMQQQQIGLYVFRNIPTDTAFAPRTRKEISQIKWFKLSELPAFKRKGTNQEDDAASKYKFYMVAPFLGPLKKWVVQQRKKDAVRASSHSHLNPHPVLEEPMTEEETATQTDPADGPSTSTPAVGSVEGANRELERLIKLQPATQGLQPSAPEPESHDKGKALIAMLQRKGPTVQQQHPVPPVNNAVPHTPLDHMQGNPPEPHSPHYHHSTQRLPDHYYQQPPPNFSVPQHTNHNQNMHYGYQNQAQGPSHGHPNYYNQNQAYQQNQPYQQSMPQMRPVQQARREPPLLHPQPRLPQVQQSVLTRGMVPTPQLEEEARMPVGGNGAGLGNGSLGNQPPYHNQGVAPVQQRNANMPPPQMNSHTMSLLNTFKSGAPRTSQPQPAQVPNGQSQQPEVGAMAPQTQQQPAAAQSLLDLVSPAQRQHYQSHDPSSNPAVASLYQQLDGTARSAPQNAPLPTQPARLPPQDAHRSAMLNLFKNPAPLSPTSSSDATVRPGKVEQARTIRGAEVPKAPVQQQYIVPHTSQSNGAPVAMNPEANLPFRALQILSRPKQVENVPVQPQYNPSAQAPPPPVHREIRHIIAPVSAQVNQPAPAPQLPAHLNQNINPFQPTGAASHSPNTGTFPAAGMLGGRQQQNPEQAKALLSLFGKAPQSSPTTGGQANLLDKGKQKEVPLQQQPISLQQSNASVSGEGIQAASRRGSGAPLAPEEKDKFLMNFLLKQLN
ncbi:hypothetical protein GE09DRAFT_93819 [Coniochaeta sp. 2T2.1]|nr:hypothetical protein GE09DRAFT_93819 [Coniochaeta sp. 2T2.1]